MRNRAKCKLCESIIESFHRYDYVKCKCGEIAVDGGPDNFRVIFNDYLNFLRLDDLGNEIEVKFKEKEKEVKPEEEYKPSKLSRVELIKMLEDLIQSIENLPTNAMTAPVTHYDLSSALLLVASILKAED